MSVAALTRAVLPGGGGRRPFALVERNLTVSRRGGWLVLVTGFGEPLLYLAGMGFGVGALVGDVTTGSGPVRYAVFVAPALMASAAMNGVVNETTYNLYWKLTYAKLYETVLSTPLGVRDVAVGELTWALLRGTAYALGFAVVMAALGLATSAWTVLTVPGAVLIGLAFGACGIAATTWMRSWHDFTAVQLVVLPLFLLSATFYPLSAYAGWAQVVVELTPLYHGVHLLRALSTGSVDATALVDVAYLVAMGLVGIAEASRRLASRLLT